MHWAKYLSTKQRSKKEIRSHLKEKGFDQTVVTATLNYLKSLNYVNDKELTISYAKYRKNFKKEGKLRIEKELLLRGLSSEDISYALKLLFQENEELDLAKSITQKFLFQKLLYLCFKIPYKNLKSLQKYKQL